MFKSYYRNPLDPQSNDVLVMDGVFYISCQAIKNNSAVAQETLKNVYKFIKQN